MNYILLNNFILIKKGFGMPNSKFDAMTGWNIYGMAPYNGAIKSNKRFKGCAGGIIGKNGEKPLNLIDVKVLDFTSSKIVVLQS